MQTESRHRMWAAIGVLSGFLFVVFWITFMVILARHSIMETRERAEARRDEPAWGPSSEHQAKPVASDQPWTQAATTSTTVAPPKSTGVRRYDMPDEVYDVYAFCIGEDGVYTRKNTDALFVVASDSNCTGSHRALDQATQVPA